MDKIRAAIKYSVCAHCIDADAAGNCLIGNGKVCPIDQHFEGIMKAVSETHSDRYEDYVAGIRTHVCENCTYGQPDSCKERDDVECALDRYYPLVVDAIETIGATNIRYAIAQRGAV